MNKDWRRALWVVIGVTLIFMSSCCKRCPTCCANEIMCSCRQPHVFITKDDGIPIQMPACRSGV